MSDESPLWQMIVQPVINLLFGRLSKWLDEHELPKFSPGKKKLALVSVILALVGTGSWYAFRTLHKPSAPTAAITSATAPAPAPLQAAAPPAPAPAQVATKAPPPQLTHRHRPAPPTAQVAATAPPARPDCKPGKGLLWEHSTITGGTESALTIAGNPNVHFCDTQINGTGKHSVVIDPEGKTLPPATAPVIGSDNTFFGPVPPATQIGNGNTFVGATDANGNTILNRGGVAIGHGATADGSSIAIGAGANGTGTAPPPE
jgi:hypothetical protein